MPDYSVCCYWARKSPIGDFTRFKDAISTHTNALKLIPFPVKKKTAPPPPSIKPDITPGEEHDASGRRNWTVDTNMKIQEILEDEEPQIRALALQAKGAGDHDAADRIAGAWSEMWYMLTCINERPRQLNEV